MTMASPTAASAAATAMTKKAMAWPDMEPCWRAKARKVRFAALSMSSMHMKTMMAFFFTSTPAKPMAKRNAASAR